MNDDIMRQAGLGAQVDLVKNGQCPTCSTIIKQEEFKDDLSRKEFKISGMCQACQDGVFSQPKEHDTPEEQEFFSKEQNSEFNKTLSEDEVKDLYGGIDG